MIMITITITITISISITITIMIMIMIMIMNYDYDYDYSEKLWRRICDLKLCSNEVFLILAGKLSASSLSHTELKLLDLLQ